MIRPTIATTKGRSDLDCNVSILPAKRLTVPSPAVSIVGIDLDHLHHTQFLVVHHVAVKHVFAGEIDDRKVMLPLRGTIAVSSQMGSSSASPLIFVNSISLTWIWKT